MEEKSSYLLGITFGLFLRPTIAAIESRSPSIGSDASVRASKPLATARLANMKIINTPDNEPNAFLSLTMTVPRVGHVRESNPQGDAPRLSSSQTI